MLKEGEVWRVDAGDNLPWLQALPTGCCSLTVTSPPYEAARTYGIGFKLQGQAWVDWMIPRVVEACRVTDGLVCVNMSAPLRDHKASPAVEWLVADLTRHHGVVLGPSPYVYFRFSVPGSGGKRYHRRDWEPVYCFARPECLPLRWSDNTCTGHPPKWAPGGEMSNRLKDGQRVSKWGGPVAKSPTCGRNKQGKQLTSQPSMRETVVNNADPSPGLFGEVEEVKEAGGSQLHPLLQGGGHGPNAGIGRNPDGSKVTRRSKAHTKRKPRGDMEDQDYAPPVLANSGNVVREVYDAEKVRGLLESFVSREVEFGDVIRCLVGGGAMGDSRLAHESEAPFSETLVEFFVRSYAKPGGIVLDPFCGSGTTPTVAVRLGRRALACDLRPKQCEVARKRVARETPDLFGGQP